MGVEVTFEAIRKSDFVPYASMWLGEGRVVNAIEATNKLAHEIDDGWVVGLEGWKEAIDFIIEIEDSFYLGNYGDEAIELIYKEQDQMAYFLRVG